MLDDCNFHESVSLDRFEAERMLELVPPDGEFALMQYRCTTVKNIATELAFKCVQWRRVEAVVLLRWGCSRPGAGALAANHQLAWCACKAPRALQEHL
jgi:Adaptor complexes medium subunit family